jgi:predicted membrane-bound spermidine synthase
MAMEVIWIRAFSPVLKTQVYSFALVLATYLGATFAGSFLYRQRLKRGGGLQPGLLVSILCMAVWLPVLVNDVRSVHADWSPAVHPWSVVLLLASITPFCAALGYLTPGLVDQYAEGHPRLAGRAYALNVLGCILGPLCASYILLPSLSERQALVVLGLPLFCFCFLSSKGLPANQLARVLGIGSAVPLLVALFFSTSYEDSLLRAPEKQTVVRRDYAASVISFVDVRKHLLVNGIGMTKLGPLTKFMVHLPLAFHNGKPESALIICFGMGTSYRSALSWGIETTAVELIPGVVKAFDYYHTNAPQVLQDRRGHIVIDDGRRFLNRTREQFDVIVIDPPPPVEAAGSSLLYSREFYETAKRHLKPNGIIQAWLPSRSGDPATVQAVIRSLRQSFPHVRGFEGVERTGIHLLASFEPIEGHKGAELAPRLPAEAARDLLEWSLFLTPADCLDNVLAEEIPLDKMLDTKSRVRITDDQPYNEYFLMRRLRLLNAWK